MFLNFYTTCAYKVYNKALDKMKKIIIVALLFIAQWANAQKAQRILSFVIEKHETEWYLEQAKLWKVEIDKNSSNAYAMKKEMP
jgi:hypothetical protein